MYGGFQGTETSADQRDPTKYVTILSGKIGYDDMGNLGANGFGADYLGGYTMAAAFVAEAVTTFIFLLVIFGATSKDAHPAMGGLAIGLALVLIHLVTIPITGTSVNPARSIGPAIVSGQYLSELWLFIVAPIVGGISAAIVWRMSFSKG